MLVEPEYEMSAGWPVELLFTAQYVYGEGQDPTVFDQTSTRPDKLAGEAAFGAASAISKSPLASRSPKPSTELPNRSPTDCPRNVCTTELSAPLNKRA